MSEDDSRKRSDGVDPTVVAVKDVMDVELRRQVDVLSKLAGSQKELQKSLRRVLTSSAFANVKLHEPSFLTALKDAAAKIGDSSKRFNESITKSVEISRGFESIAKAMMTFQISTKNRVASTDFVAKVAELSRARQAEISARDEWNQVADLAAISRDFRAVGDDIREAKAVVVVESD